MIAKLFFTENFFYDRKNLIEVLNELSNEGIKIPGHYEIPDTPKARSILSKVIIDLHSYWAENNKNPKMYSSIVDIPLGLLLEIYCHVFNVEIFYDRVNNLYTLEYDSSTNERLVSFCQAQYK